MPEPWQKLEQQALTKVSPNSVDALLKEVFDDRAALKDPADFKKYMDQLSKDMIKKGELPQLEIVESALILSSASKRITPQEANDFFITQIKSAYNKSGDPYDSNNECGPTSLAMVLEHFKNLEGLDPNALIRDSRYLMTGNFYRGDRGVSFAEIANGAQKSNLTVDKDIKSVDDIDKALSANKLVIALGLPEKVYAQNLKDYPPTGDHYVVIVKEDNGIYTINDPLYKKGPITLTRDELKKFLLEEVSGGEVGIALGQT